MASPESDKFTIAIQDGVNGATDQTTVVIDKSGFSDLSDLERSQKVEAAIREQLPPGEADKFIKATIANTKENIVSFAYGDDELADLLVDQLEDKGYNLYNILVKPRSEGAFSQYQGAGGTEFCSIEHGNLEGQVDEMATNISHATGGNIEDIRKNFTADPAEHAKRTGAHEAQHCDGSSGLHGESHADKESYDNISAKAALEFRDYRSITAMYDAGHASNPIVMGNQPSGSPSLEFKVGQLHSGVSRVFDSLVEDYMGVDNETHSSEWDINKYAAASDELREDLISSANAMPDGPEKTEALMVAEATINYAEDYEDAYRRRVLGEDVPERTPIELVPVEAKTDFYKNHFDFDDYSKKNVAELHSNITNTIKNYVGTQDSTAGWESAPEDPGVSSIAMEGDQNRSNITTEIEIPQINLQVKPVDFNV